MTFIIFNQSLFDLNVPAYARVEKSEACSMKRTVCV